MFTVILAFIDANYNINFDYLYLGTFIIDLEMFKTIMNHSNNKIKEKCNHDWEIFKENKLVDENGHYLETEYILKCKKCGDIKKK